MKNKFHHNNHQGNDYYNNNNTNEPIFDYKGIIQPLLANAEKGKKNIVLLTTGAFNPIHRMHLEILNIAYKHLLKDYNVLCAFISPSADCYVKYKRPPNFPFDIRCEMIQASIEDFYNENKEKEKEMLKIYLNEWEGSHDFFIDFPEVTMHIQNELYKIGEIELLYVCGIDHYIKCFYSFDRNVIAIDREPYKINENDNRFKNNPKKLIFIVKDKNTAPFSSTSIKVSYEKNDLETIEKCTFPNVFKMIVNYLDCLNPEKHKEQNHEEINNQQQHKDI